MNSQLSLLLYGRIDGASVAPSFLVSKCKTYREAVRMCWVLRRVHGMTLRQLSAEGGFYPQHVGDWLNPDDKPKRRDLPAAAIAGFEALTGNTLISQWIAARQGLTVLEEITATRNAA